MFSAALQAWDFYHTGRMHTFLLYALWAWLIVWLPRAVLATRFNPSRYAAPFTTTTSVIVPVCNEDGVEFRSVLTRIVRQEPTEVVVVINGPRNLELEAVCAEFPGIQQLWNPVANKRKAIVAGMLRTTSDILVIVDSDTLWSTNVLEELVKPFADARVGGVTTHQEIFRPERTLWTRYAGWLEANRWQWSARAQSAFGMVGVLPGRTIAFRRSLFDRSDIIDRFINERFLGTRIEMSDDREMTMLVIGQGFQTVYQPSARVLTDAPTTYWKYLRQQYRWAKGSQFMTLKYAGMMLRKAPFTAFCFIIDVMTPFFFLGVMLAFVYRTATHAPVFSVLVGTPFADPRVFILGSLIGWYVTTLVRQLPLLLRQPTQLLWMPWYLVCAYIVQLPARVAGLATAAMTIGSGWGTRKTS